MNTPIPPRIPTPPPVPLPLAHQAAKASWVAVLISIGMPLLMTNTRGNVMVWLLAFFLTLVGFVFGIAALFGIPRYGTKGILLPALIGIILNGLIIVMFITMIASAFSRARQRQKAEASGVIIVGASTRPGSVYFWQPNRPHLGLCPTGTPDAAC